MNLKEMVKYVLDTMSAEEGDRRTEALIVAAINDAYIELSKLDCVVGVEEYDEPQRTLILPDDFLVDLQVSHSSIGKLNEMQYKVMANKLILSAVALQRGIITLLYGKYPTVLSDSDDEPVLREDLHRALCHYALHALTSNQQYLEQYTVTAMSIPEFEPFLEESVDEETVRDIYVRGAYNA